MAMIPRYSVFTRLIAASKYLIFPPERDGEAYRRHSLHRRRKMNKMLRVEVELRQPPAPLTPVVDRAVSPDDRATKPMSPTGTDRSRPAAPPFFRADAPTSQSRGYMCQAVPASFVY